MTLIAFPAYTPVDREAIWAGLFAWLQKQLGGTFRTMGRKLIAPPDLTIADQPALFQVATTELHIPRESTGLPSKIMLRGFLVVYVFHDRSTEEIRQGTLLGEMQLNNLLETIVRAFVPDNPITGTFTINRLVTHCWIERDTDLDHGIFGSQATAILPINIIV